MFLRIKVAEQSENKIQNTKAVYFLKERHTFYFQHLPTFPLLWSGTVPVLGLSLLQEIKLNLVLDSV